MYNIFGEKLDKNIPVTAKHIISDLKKRGMMDDGQTVFAETVTLMVANIQNAINYTI